MKKQISLIGLIVFAGVLNTYAYKSLDDSGHLRAKGSNNEADHVLASGCAPATAQNDLDVNNVRAKIMNGGDMWWDIFGGGLPRYEIPKNSGISALFASALWMGGIDEGNQLKVAAMTYRQSPGGNDFYPGPLDNNAAIDEATCKTWDRQFKMTFKEVYEYTSGIGSLTTNLEQWPGDGPNGMLAPYFDQNGNGEYDPEVADKDGKHDFPWYNLNGKDKSAKLYGDQTLFWVFNDVGNIHQNSQTPSIGIEIQAQGFGFSTNDAINDMTFYKYKIINRSSTKLTKTYFGQWVDSDLGACFDDYVGCDVRRGLGYTYNGDAVDDNNPKPCSGELSYGSTPPAVGLDFFQGPIADPGDGIDNNRNGVIDEADEQIIMSKFVYFNNDASNQGDPKKGIEYYQYLSGFWRDGTPFTYGKNAYKTGGPVCDFMFPDTSDVKVGWGTGFQPQAAWSEYGENNTPDDRRFVISAGPFTLDPGAVNYITVGAVWARATSGDNKSSILSLFKADDAAQKLFDKNFKTLDGPQAPDVNIQELDEEIILYLSNSPASNNYLEAYQEMDDVNIIDAPGCSVTYNKYYRFEGYLIYQLKDASVSTKDLNDPSKARLIAQCDLKNGVKTLTNYYEPCPIDGVNGQCGVQVVPQAADSGIIHSFRITTDAFATGDNKLVNHRQYFYKALAYAYNNYKPYAMDRVSSPCDTLQVGVDGQKKPCLIGRIGSDIIKTAMPHNPAPRSGGTEVNASYGDGVKLTRIEGQGNGGNVVDLTQESIDQIIASSSARILTPTYEAGRGPIKIRVVDPLKVSGDNFRIQLVHPTGVYGGLNSSSEVARISDNCKWVLTNLSTGKKVYSDQAINVNYEQLIPEWGISVSMQTAVDAGTPNQPESNKNGVLEGSSLTFADVEKQWLYGVADVDGSTAKNWIRSQSDGECKAGAANSAYFTTQHCADAQGNKFDTYKNFQTIVGATWGPYRICGYSSLANKEYAQPAVNESAVLQNAAKLSTVASVDVVFTSDKSKWTRCPVLESCDFPALAEGGSAKLALRAHASVDKYGNVGDGVVTTDPNDADYIAVNGMGWFPGYAINVETGERLNMAFAEDSWNAIDRGKDMIWNPTSTIQNDTGYYSFGGRHFVYVFGHNGEELWPANDTKLPNENKSVPRYDYGKAIYRMLNAAGNAVSGAQAQYRKAVFADGMWVNIPLVRKGFYFSTPADIPCDAKVRIRVKRAFKRGYSGVYGAKTTNRSTDSSATPVNNNFPMYEFSTASLKANEYSENAAKNALDIINIVPNPYYAFSKYEGTSTVRAQFDNRVRITNLPQICTVSVFTINGTLVRKLKKDDALSYLDWDIKNQAQIPVASGLYIVHIDVPNVGEKILKWFGVMRPIDLDSY